MKKNILTLLAILIHGASSFAQTHMTLVSGITSQAVFRGAPIWAGPAMFIGPGFVFFEKLQVNGPSVSWNFFEREDSQALKIEARYFDDEKPMIRLGDTKKTYRNSRTSSVMTSFEYKYRFGWMQKFHLGIFVEKEIKNYKGLYSLLEFAVPVLPFTTFTMSASVGEKSTNRFIYGEQAGSGIGYHEYKLSNMFPFVPWKGRIITSASFQVVSTGKARHANLVRGDYKNWQISSLVMWDVF